MPRSLLVLTLAAVLLVGAVACGDEGTSDGGGTPAPAATTPAPPVETTPAASSDAAAQYADLCAGCHKADGSGGFGPDLRGEDNVGGIAEQIREGGGRMPSFSGDLTDAEIQALAGYVANEL